MIRPHASRSRRRPVAPTGRLPLAAGALGALCGAAPLAASQPAAPGFWGRLFDTSGFPARWRCGEWTPAHGNLHIVSDLLIFGAYMAIPIVMTLLLRRRRDIPFPGLGWLFVTFILACGLTHLFEAAMFWWPAYRAMGVAKGVTAGVSWLTVVALVPAVPKVLALRNPHEARLAALVDSAYEAIVAVDNRGRVTSWNRAAERIFGFAPSEVLGGDLRQLIGVDPGDLAAGDRAGGFEIESRRKSGELVHLLAQASPIVDEHGALIGHSLIAHDITQRKSAERQLLERTTELERSNQDLDQFAYVASHDLKAPLRAIGQLASWLEEDLGQQVSAESREHLQLLQSRTGRMNALLDSLLEYSRAGHADLEVRVIDLDRLVAESVNLAAVPDRFTVPPELTSVPPFEGHSIALQQVLTNLIANSVKHHDRDTGTIEVAARVEGSRLVISVVDDGPGVDEAFRERIFNLFQTLRPRDEVEGSGVGLALVKKLVERFGGTVAVGSNGDRGAVFTFDWPLLPLSTGSRIR